MDTSPFDQTDDETFSDPVATASPPAAQSYSFPSDGGSGDDGTGEGMPPQDDDFSEGGGGAEAAEPDTASPSSGPGAVADESTAPGLGSGMASSPGPSPDAANRLRRGKVNGEDIAHYGLEYYTTLDGAPSKSDTGSYGAGDSPGGSGQNIPDWVGPPLSYLPPVTHGPSWSFDGPYPEDDVPPGSGLATGGFVPGWGTNLRGSSWSFDGPYPDDAIPSASGAAEPGPAAVDAGPASPAEADPAPPLTPERAQFHLDAIAAANGRRAAKGLPPITPPSALLAAAYPDGGLGVSGIPGLENVGSSVPAAGSSAPGSAAGGASWEDRVRQGIDGINPFSSPPTPGTEEPASSGQEAGPSAADVGARAMPPPDPKAPAPQPFLPGEPAFRVRENGFVELDPARLPEALYAAYRAGAIGGPEAFALMPQAEAAQAAIAERQQLLAKDGLGEKLKALGVGAAKGGMAWAGGVAGAEIGAFAGPLDEITVPLFALGGGIVGYWSMSKILDQLAQCSDTIKSFTDAAQLHPYYDAAGNLLTVGLGALPETLENLSTEAGLRAAAGASVPTIGKALIWRVGQSGMTNAAVDTVLKEGAKALGFGDGQTLSGAVQATILGTFFSGHGISFRNFEPQEVGSILVRMREATARGVDPQTVLTPQEMEAGRAALAEMQRRTVTGTVPANPQVSVRQAQQGGRNYGVSAGTVEEGTPGTAGGAGTGAGVPGGIPGLPAPAPQLPDAAKAGAAPAPVESPNVPGETTGKNSSLSASQPGGNEVPVPDELSPLVPVVRKKLDGIVNLYTDRIAKQGIDTVDGPGGTFRMNQDADGRIFAEFDKDWLARRVVGATGGNMEAAEYMAHQVLDEEVAHGALLNSLRQRWLTEGGKAVQGPFDDYVFDHRERVANDVIDHVESLPAPQREQAISDVATLVRLYDGYNPMPDAAVWNRLKTFPKMRQTFSGEAARQLSQMERLGETAETGYLALKDIDAHTYFNHLLKGILERTKEGLLGSQLPQDVAKTQAALYGPAKGKN